MKNFVIGIVVVIGVMAGFLGGAKYEQGKTTPASSATAAGRAGAGRFGAGLGGGGTFGGGGLVVGTITKVGNGTITVKDSRTSASYTVTIGSSTKISKVSSGTSSDLALNQTVTVAGPTSGTDVTANSVTVGSAGIVGGRFGGGRPTASPTP